ncbi:hypothetical protein KBX53_13010 [Micromonospora sp. M51]|uniref:Universal stress protein n=1 Tax=Micromonospora parva TaxID=1464048 RepID=A0ABW6VST6_9ACTN|nr:MULTISPECIES: hypothetical protein [Micromonospora]MBQ1011850.1 hypothetical protein [Micromonospora sp. M51]MBQ1034214.1 hypothetical protein [Micromonospora sp. C97]
MSRRTGAHRVVVGVDRSFAGMQALRRATQLAATIRRFARDLERLSR